MVTPRIPRSPDDGPDWYLRFSRYVRCACCGKWTPYRWRFDFSHEYRCIGCGRWCDYEKRST